MEPSHFETRNVEFEQRTRESFARQNFMGFLGANLHNVRPGRVEIWLPHKVGLNQQHGFFHGGAIGTIADNAGGYAPFTLMAASESVLTVEYKLNIMAPAEGELLIARGRVIRAGRRISVCQSDVFCRNDGIETHCASSLGTFMAMMDVADDASGR